MATAAVQTILNYTHPKGNHELYPGTAQTYLEVRESVPTTVRSARGIENQFSLDKQGFEFHQHVSHATFAEGDENKEAVKATYYPEVIELIKQK